MWGGEVSLPFLVSAYGNRICSMMKEREKMEQFLRVGVISSTHGVRGEVKVFPTTDDPERFKVLKKVLLDTGKEHRELEITGVKFFKNQVILKFKGYDNIKDRKSVV